MTEPRCGTVRPGGVDGLSPEHSLKLGCVWVGVGAGQGLGTGMRRTHDEQSAGFDLLVFISLGECGFCQQRK